MKRELGIARCGLACCLCAQNEKCPGCDSDECQGRLWCENRKCSIEKEIKGCYVCDETCTKGLLGKLKPSAFRTFIQRYGAQELMDCLERNEQSGIVYHRDGIQGDYDDFEDLESLISFIKNGR